MGYRSDVKLLIAKKGYELLKDTCLKSDKDYVRNMVNINSDGLDSIEFSESNKSLPNNSVILGWNDVKWYSHYEDVTAIESTLRKLDEMVEEDPEKLDDYFYKKIEIEENGAITEDTNDYDSEFVGNFYVIQHFSL